MIKSHKITKAYNDHTVLKELDFNIQTGDIAFLVGQSGSGKSTLLRILCGIEDFDQGHFQIFDHVVRHDTSHKIDHWPNVTMVFQDLFLWPHLTAEKNISVPISYRFGHEESLEITSSIIKQLAITEFAKKFPNEISRGQQQLVAIARAIALQPKVLLLDECTASLDMSKVALISDILQVFSARGMTIVAVTHQLGFAKHTASKILYLQDGQIVETGTAEILDSPRSVEFVHFLELARRTT